MAKGKKRKTTTKDGFGAIRKSMARHPLSWVVVLFGYPLALAGLGVGGLSTDSGTALMILSLALVVIATQNLHVLEED